MEEQAHPTRDHWRPYKLAPDGSTICRIRRCGYQPAIDLNGPNAAACPPGQGLPAPPDFHSARVIMWYQPTCVACQNSEPVFQALANRAAAGGGFTVHRVEATPELLKAFPHVTVVPLYDHVTPTSEAGACSPYGPGTHLRSIRNDLGALQDAFGPLVLTR